MNRTELEKLFESVGKGKVDSAISESDKTTKKIVRNINGLNQDVFEYLESIIGEDGKIPSSKVNSANSSIREIEFEYITELEDSITNSIEKIGSETVDEYVKKSSSVKTVVSLLSAPLITSIKDDIVREVFSREIKGTSLRSRIRGLSVILSSEVSKSVRYGILMKESISKISRRVRDVIKASTWQIKRLISSEILTALRIAALVFGEHTGILEGIKIIDNRGRHGGHHLHKCYEYAEEDKYGMGKGIYKTKDRYILDPHPQCTAYFSFILKDELFGKDAD